MISLHLDRNKKNFEELVFIKLSKLNTLPRTMVIKFLMTILSNLCMKLFNCRLAVLQF